MALPVKRDATVALPPPASDAPDAAPDVAGAGGKETGAAAETDIAGVYPNPPVIGGTWTQAGRSSGGASVPLVIFGRRGAARAASRADLGVVQIETTATRSDVRAGAGKAF